jgi:aquaporin Z
MTAPLARRLLAEFLGSAFLAALVIGSGIAAQDLSQDTGLRLLENAAATAAGLFAIILMFGPISGGHFNPAVSAGLWAGGRFSGDQLLPYIVAQVLGAVAGAAILALIATGKPGFELAASGFAANGFGEHSPGGYSLTAGLVTEVIMTFMFLLVILGATHRKAPTGFAGLAIGLALTLIHLISIPVTNTSVNPARSTSQALFVGGWALRQLWLFWVAPIVGAVLAGAVHRTFLQGEEEPDVRGR